ncbi:hypothetical protein ET475_14385 [Microbacterium protaetiae]|uniref:Uncharacterized protein n=1 Tax=Microbacterium protaetiae TaxID=2509458 RepID=A0A4P6EGM4_9MICO|nr:hypothetical protein [Microbacterium protaetiae]QAY61056.1 hypothetical protein ET475_14385 [Microbacterium protaetiae]
MAARILQLRLALLLAPLRAGGRAVRAGAGVVLLAAAVAVGCWGLLTLHSAGVDAAAVVTVLGGSALTLGFMAAPLIVGGSDPLDPRAFRAFAMGSGPLSATLALVGLVSVPLLALIALAVCVAVLWTQRGAPTGFAVTGAVLGVVTCALSARVFGAVATAVLAPRRSRELTGLFLVAVLVVVVPAGTFFASLHWDQHIPAPLLRAVEILARTPLGAGWALAWRQDAASLAVAAATVIVLAGLWWALVDRVMRTSERPVAAQGSGGLGWFAITPATPGGAVAARSLAYWLADRRYLVNLVVIPFAAAAAMVPLLVVGVPFHWVILVPAPLMALFLGWLPHNDLAYDSTAVWLHLATGVRGISDRAGRLVPVLVIGIAALAIAVPVTASLHGDAAMAPPMIGVCASLFLSGLGLSSIASAATPSAVTPPGESPFRQPERTGAAGAVAQGSVLLASLALSVPAVWWTWLSIDDERYVGVALWGGLGIGLVVLALGLTVGSLVFERRGTRLLELAESF